MYPSVYLEALPFRDESWSKAQGVPIQLHLPFVLCPLADKHGWVLLLSPNFEILLSVSFLTFFFLGGGGVY